MPAAAVVGIFASGAALATGTLTTMATIAAIGTMVASIGVLTQNKTLMTIGAVASLAGGVGAFAQSQGWMASGTTASALGDTAATNTATMADAAGVGVENAAPVVDTGAVTGAVDASGAAQSVIEQAAPAITTADNITQTSALAQPGGLIDAGNLNPTAPTTVGSPGAAGEALSKSTLDGTNVFGANSAAGAAPGSTATGSIFDTLKGGFDSIFRNGDGTLNKDMLSLTGKFIGGMFDEKTEAETDYYKAKANEVNFQVANGQSVPYLPTKLNGSVGFNKNAPTYRAPQVGSLYNAR